MSEEMKKAEATEATKGVRASCTVKMDNVLLREIDGELLLVVCIANVEDAHIKSSSTFSGNGGLSEILAIASGAGEALIGPLKDVLEDMPTEVLKGMLSLAFMRGAEVALKSLEADIPAPTTVEQ